MREGGVGEGMYGEGGLNDLFMFQWATKKCFVVANRLLWLIFILFGTRRLENGVSNVGNSSAVSILQTLSLYILFFKIHDLI